MRIGTVSLTEKGDGVMPGDFIDLTAPSLQGGRIRRPEDLPHGLITPPEKVRELIEKERAKHPPEAFARAEERLLNDWTLQYYFDYLGHEVLYRQTPEGPEVLAVGLEEILACTNRKDPELMAGLKTWMG
jgi:hypothetical protein